MAPPSFYRHGAIKNGIKDFLTEELDKKEKNVSRGER